MKNQDKIIEIAINPISEYCKRRYYHCKGCKFSIKGLMPDYKGYATCIFSNCPCDWMKKEDV